MTEKFEFYFYLSERHGLIRQRHSATARDYPEVWRNDRWVTGTPYVVDAITGMGEDPYSCGEQADDLTVADAEAYASTRGIRLYEVL